MNWLFLLLIALAPNGSDKPIREVLVYEIERTPGVGEMGLEAGMKSAVAMLNRRINPPGKMRARIRSLGQGRIEVAVYANDPNMVERIESMVEAPGTLEFRVLANRRDHPATIDRANRLEATQRVATDPGGTPLARWIPVWPGKEGSFTGDEEIATRKRKQGGSELLEVLVVMDRYDVTGAHLVRAGVAKDEAGRPCIHLTFGPEGGLRLHALTSANRPVEGENPFTRKLGIILDGYLNAAPAIRSTISRDAQITGDFTREEAQDLVDVLNSGRLPVTLTKVHRQAKDTAR